MSQFDGGEDAGVSQMSDEPVDAGVVAGCPEPEITACPSDFEINAPCRIINGNSHIIRITANDLPYTSGGQFHWSTTSSKIRLTHADTRQVTVLALEPFSDALDAEVITVTRTGYGCAPITKTINVTVAKVTFSESPFQSYGYDDNDNNQRRNTSAINDHLSIRKSKHSFIKVTIEGGPLGTDFDFLCDDTNICSPVVGSAAPQFDLRLNAGTTNNGTTNLHAKVKCPSATSFAQIAVHVYKEKVAEIIVGKFRHRGHGNLHFPDADYSTFAADANQKLKHGVVKYNINNLNADNSVSSVAFSPHAGVFTYDIINPSNSGDYNNMMTAFANAPANSIKVAIVRNMRSYYYLQNEALINTDTLTFDAPNADDIYFNDGDSFQIRSQTVTLVSRNGNILTVSPPLATTYPARTPIEFPAAAWSGNPIILSEGHASLDETKWTVVHEVGHTALKLVDVDENDTFMYFQQGSVDNRLRYCARTQHYDPFGNEIQWEVIPRT